jgi:ATP-dependent Clp protease ATP-binding subunit ClpB
LLVLDEGRLTDNKGRLADFKTHYNHDFKHGKPDYSGEFENLKGSMEEATEAAKEKCLIKTNCSSRIHQPHR